MLLIWLLPALATRTSQQSCVGGDNGAVCACNDGLRNVSKFHISGLGKMALAHDMNAIFQWKRKWHVMHQGDSNWRHVVSDDLLRWKRLPDALVGHGSWDGALSILDDGKPVILFDCASVVHCLPPHAASASGIADSSGDPPIVGVARPADIMDPLLVNWTKDTRNPIHISNSPRKYAGPSNIWRGKNGNLQMKMILESNDGGSTMGLYESSDDSLHSWSLVVGDFYPVWGGGGGMFYELPASAVIGETNYTHITNLFGGFALGTIDAVSGKFIAGARIPYVGSGAYPMINVIERRILLMGWVIAGIMRPGPPRPHREIGLGDCLTIPREVRYDASLSQLLVTPVDETAALRDAVLGRRSTAKVLPGQSMPLLDTAGATAFDLEIIFMLVPHAAFAVDVALLTLRPTRPANCEGVVGSHGGDCSGIVVGLNATVAGSASGRRTAVLSVAGQVVNTFTVPANEHSLSLRALADRNVVEVFVADGRGVFTSAVNISGTGMPGAFLTARLTATVVSATVWGMGCGWAATLPSYSQEFHV